LPRGEGVVYPVCLAGARACPPEDCGGVSSFAEMLENNDWEFYPWYKPDSFSPEKVSFCDPRSELEGLFRDNPELNYYLRLKDYLNQIT